MRIDARVIFAFFLTIGNITVLKSSALIYKSPQHVFYSRIPNILILNGRHLPRPTWASYEEALDTVAEAFFFFFLSTLARSVALMI
jgi:hypothetical protein